MDGKATAAALAAVAAAFGVRPGAVTLVTGAASRVKVINVAGRIQPTWPACGTASPDRTRPPPRRSAHHRMCPAGTFALGTTTGALTVATIQSLRVIQAVA
jgi:hypothetical protein